MRLGLVPVLLGLGLAACESGTSRRVEIVVDAGIAEVFTAEAPGIVVTDVAGFPLGVAAFCGGPSPVDPFTVFVDDGFGCLREVAGQGEEQRIEAWVEPAPVLYDRNLLCAAERDTSGVLNLPAPGSEGLAASPDAAWAQGSVVGVWARDVSPCGGTLEGGTLRVRQP